MAEAINQDQLNEAVAKAIDAQKENSENYKQLTSELRGLTDTIKEAKRLISLAKSPLLDSIASLLTNTQLLKEQKDILQKELSEKSKALQEEKNRESLAKKLQQVNDSALKQLQASRDEQEHVGYALVELSDKIKEQIVAKEQEIQQTQLAALKEKEGREQALEAQKAAIQSKIAELQESRKNKDSGKTGGEIKKEIKALREQEASLASQYEELYASAGEGLIAQSKLNEQQSELSKLKETLADVDQKHLDNIGEQTLMEDLYKTQLADLTDRQRIYSETIADSQKKQKELEPEVKKLTKDIKQVNPKMLAQAITDIVRVLDALVDPIRKTQQAFGISAKQAFNLNIGNFGKSLTSYANVFSGLAPVTAEELKSAQQAFQEEFGGVITPSAATEIASTAKTLGVTTQQLASARRVFMTSTMGNVNAAISQQDKFIREFEKKGLTSKDALDAIAKNSEIFARNGTRFAQAFARAAADAKKIGVDIAKISQVGDTIIGDYESFLVKTAELGAMGFNLDSARLAEISLTGDDAALLDELRSQFATTGKDITNLNRAEQLALSQAFGLTVAELQKLAAPTEGSGEQLSVIEKGNNALINTFERFAGILRGIAAVIGGVIASSVALTALNTTRIAVMMTGKGIFSGISDMFKSKGAGVKTTAVKIIKTVTSPLSKVGSVAKSAAGSVTKLAPKALSGIGTAANIGKGVLGKVALPLTVGMSAFGAYKGFMADKEASFGERLKNAGSGALSSLTFGLLGKDANEIREATRGRVRTPTPITSAPSVPSSAAIGAAAVTTTTTPAQSAPTPPAPAPTTPPVDFAPLEKKLDAVVAAIGRMSVQLDGNKVGRVVATTAASTAQVGVLARSS